MSGSTSQPNLNTIVGSLRGTERDTELDSEALGDCSLYWETVRTYYRPFDNAPRSGSARLYDHEIPGGQFTNLQQQATALGLGQRWREVEEMYADVNRLLGDIVKVTPSSKVVGDLALFLLSKGMTCDEVRQLPPDHNVGFPESVVDMMRGSLGEPPGGWPEDVRRILLCRSEPIEGRAGAGLPSADIEAAVETASELLGRAGQRADGLSYLLYPTEFAGFRGDSAQIRRRRTASDPGVFLRAGGRRGVRVRHRAREAVVREIPHRGRGAARWFASHTSST